MFMFFDSSVSDNSSNNNDFGRALEFVCINTLHEAISKRRNNVSLIKNSQLTKASKSWDLVYNHCPNLAENMIKACDALVPDFFNYEPCLIEQSDDLLTLEIQADRKGETGDVRDVVIKRITNSEITWQIGISLKHNHFAVKHSRLSNDIDFGDKWFSMPCSQTYKESIKSTFDDLKAREEKKELFKNIPNKIENVYKPVLDAFKAEIKRAYDSDQTMVSRLVEYLLGGYDFWKLIEVDNNRQTNLTAFNIKGSLAYKSKIKVLKTQLPTRLFQIDYKPGSSTTLELIMDNGWQFTFRLHSARSLCEPSLKFDIQMEGMPANLFMIRLTWI